ncbi:MAG: hypothetical protein HKN16_02695, partial [Saprospiraceae bacterium]|nr:hypothetical protein [Saprospiraceae bacterium]
LSCLFLALPIITTAQDEQVYMAVDYMKVEPQNVDDYLKLEKAWKKIHFGAVHLGNCDGWYLEQIVSPFGTNLEYNYVTMRIYRGTRKLARTFDQGMLPKKWESYLNPAELELVERTEDLRKLVKQEVFVMESDAMPKDWKHPKFKVTNYMKVKDGSSFDEYAALEHEIWKPLHDKMLEQGKRRGWGLFERFLPYGSSYGYNGVTVDYFDSMEQFFNLPFEEAFAAVHPSKDADALQKKTNATRDLLWCEVSVLVDFVDASSSASARTN